MFKGLPARAIHLGFALTLAFLIYPLSKGKRISFFDILISFIGTFLISCGAVKEGFTNQKKNPLAKVQIEVEY